LPKVLWFPKYWGTSKIWLKTVQTVFGTPTYLVLINSEEWFRAMKGTGSSLGSDLFLLIPRCRGGLRIFPSSLGGLIDISGSGSIFPTPGLPRVRFKLDEPGLGLRVFSRIRLS